MTNIYLVYFCRLSENLTPLHGVVIYLEVCAIKTILTGLFFRILTFPTGQFAIDGFATPFRLDRNANGGGLLVYVRSDIPSHQLKSFRFSNDIECISFEINLRKKKWVLFSVYRPPTQSQDNLFENLGLALDHYSENYDNFMFLGDFDMTETEGKLKHFLDLYSPKNLVKESTCYKSHTPKCIDLVLTNRDRSVQKTTVVETGLSDFHKMVVTVLKTTFPKQVPTVINYRNYKKYNENVFKSDLREELQRIEPLDLNYSSFETAFDRNKTFKNKIDRTLSRVALKHDFSSSPTF